MIGSLGDFIFEVSDEGVRTFQDLSFTHSAKYAEHAIHGQKGLLEFTGLNASTCTITIKLAAFLGTNPDAELELIKNMMDGPEAFTFMLDGQIIGENLWVIESITENREQVDNFGGTIINSITLRLKEYL